MVLLYQVIYKDNNKSDLHGSRGTLRSLQSDRRRASQGSRSGSGYESRRKAADGASESSVSSSRRDRKSRALDSRIMVSLALVISHETDSSKLLIGTIQGTNAPIYFMKAQKLTFTKMPGKLRCHGNRPQNLNKI